VFYYYFYEYRESVCSVIIFMNIEREFNKHANKLSKRALSMQEGMLLE
jgi:hypothetical protein